ncbi:MAG: DUF5930 domain-containing protein [Pseudomonadota bacterium]
MIRELSARVNDALSKIVPERRIILRSPETASYHRLTPLMQCAAAALVVASVSGLGYFGYEALRGDVAVAKASEREDALRARYEARIAALEADRMRLADDLSDARGTAHIALSRLSTQHASLSDAAAIERELASALSAQRDKLDDLAGEHDETVQICEATSHRVTSLEVELHRLQTENETLVETVGDLNQTIAAVADQRDDANAGEKQLTLRLEDLNSELAAQAERRDRILNQLEQAAELGLGAMEGVLEKSGVEVEPILNAVRREFSGQGGPFLPADQVEALSEEEGDVGRIAPLMSDLEKLNLLRIAVDRLPFARPVGAARMTSPFGPRRDPINGGRAFHSGVDYAAPRGTPIYSTASGEVVKATTMRGYGRIVILRHAFGYETVYAHLHRIRVKVGDVVERGDRIGDMGNTGRSTGTHLHYEVRINGKAVNPANYIEAARHVL